LVNCSNREKHQVQIYTGFNPLAPATDAIDEMKEGEYGYHSIWSNLPRFIRKSAEKRTKARKEITK
jgi:hypothetical protein